MSLTLHLERKDKNSPFLSIQTFIHRILLQQQAIEIDKLWKKYSMMESNSYLIKTHNITYQIFKEIVEMIISTYHPYSLKLHSIEYNQMKIPSSSDDMIPLNLK